MGSCACYSICTMEVLNMRLFFCLSVFLPSFLSSQWSSDGKKQNRMRLSRAIALHSLTIAAGRQEESRHFLPLLLSSSSSILSLFFFLLLFSIRQTKLALINPKNDGKIIIPPPSDWSTLLYTTTSTYMCVSVCTYLSASAESVPVWAAVSARHVYMYEHEIYA